MDLVIEVAAAHQDWTQKQIAEHCGSTTGAVKVILCKARKLGKIKPREIDSTRSHNSPTYFDWLPVARRAEYESLRRKAGAAEARRMILEDLQIISMRAGSGELVG